ncbi:MAG TPA: hypothetical protein VNA19_13660 [Pyrinomonadaceae bacterium]|jgi:hypothetical protein|nr:hypothetical protein [Pyrinomonadaceae bacterium]
MSKVFIIRLCCALLLLASAGCAAKTGSIEPTAPDTNQANAAKSPATANASIPACTALTSAEIEAVQGEAVRETQGNNQTGGGLSVSHCVYVLPTFTRSLSFDITRADQSSASKDALKKFWEIRFRQPPGRSEEEEEERERGEKRERGEERGKKSEAEREKEKEESAKARAVSGVGEEAFWVGGRIKGTLYVRSKDVVLILSLGGADDDQTKIKKTSQLAQMALKRL